MESIKIEIEMPKEFEKYIDKSDKSYTKKVKELMLYQCIKDNKISFGKAAELMEISKHEYITDLGKMGIPYFDNDISEVLKDIENLEEMLEDK